LDKMAFSILFDPQPAKFVKKLDNEAKERIGRTLNEDEILIAKKGLENGLLFDIDSVYDTILFEMIEQ